MEKREDVVQPPTHQPERYQPFDIHQQLAYAVKASLVSSRDKDPAVRIEVPFDRLMFQGGLKTAGKFVKKVRDEEQYTINQYEDLVPFLGERWFIRGINAHLDFCAVIKETVIYHLHKKPPIVDHVNGTIEGGYVLVFKFVRFDGVKDQLTNFNIHM